MCLQWWVSFNVIVIIIENIKRQKTLSLALSPLLRFCVKLRMGKISFSVDSGFSIEATWSERFYIFIGWLNLFIHSLPPHFLLFSIFLFRFVRIWLSTLNRSILNNVRFCRERIHYVCHSSAFRFIISRTNHHFVSNFMAFNDGQFLTFSFYCRG